MSHDRKCEGLADDLLGNHHKTINSAELVQTISHLRKASPRVIHNERKLYLTHTLQTELS